MRSAKENNSQVKPKGKIGKMWEVRLKRNMGSKLIIGPEAQIEIYDALEWHESRQIGLGEEFLDYLEGYFETLKSGHIYFPIK